MPESSVTPPATWAFRLRRRNIVHIRRPNAPASLCGCDVTDTINLGAFGTLEHLWLYCRHQALSECRTCDRLARKEGGDNA